MKAWSLVAPTLLVLTAVPACLPKLPNPSVQPRIGNVRVTDSLERQRYEGPILALDSTKMEMFDLSSQTRITVLANQPVSIQVYRGQRRGMDVMAENALRSTAASVAGGLFTALVFKAVFGDDVDLGEGAKSALAGGISVGVVGGALEAWNEGAPAWETITLRQLYQDVQGIVATRTAEPQ